MYQQTKTCLTIFNHLESFKSNSAFFPGRTLDVFESATFINAKHNPFNVMNGRFIAKKKGLYLVYAQVCSYFVGKL